MRRIYFLVPDLKTASTVTDELLLARIEERHIHVIAREGTELGNLPKASLLQTSDVIPAVERGLAVGGVTGILAGVAAVCLENAVNRERLRVAGITDALTGLYNRRHLQHRLEQEVTRARRYRQPLSCLFVDADHFKRINDTHGHAAGDQVLAALAQKLRARLRSSDLAARYGGEEFALLLPQTGIRAAHRLARDICTAVAAAPIVLDDGESVAVTVSVGVAAVSGNGHGSPRDLSQGLLQAADEAVYRAKAAGRNRVICAAPTAPMNRAQ